jgi:hypothetical protein
MKHRASRELYDYWNRVRGARIAPDRDAIEPGAIRNILGDSYVLAQEHLEEAVVRLAGTRLCALFGRELKGVTFLTLWSASYRTEVLRLIDQCGSDASGIVAGVTGETAEGDTVNLEWLLLPLRHDRKLGARLIGILAPHAVPCWIGARPVQALTLKGWRRIGPAIEAATVPNDVSLVGEPPGRPVLVVYPGGRA